MKFRLILIVAVMVLWALNASDLLAQGNRALEADGSSDYIILNAPVNLERTWTIEAWFKFPLPPTPRWNTLTRGTNDHQVSVFQGRDLGTFDNASGTGFHDSGYDMNGLSEGWHHIAAIASNGITNFYVDGTFVGNSNFQSTADVIVIGNAPAGTQPFGTTDEVRIWSVARAQQEIQATMKTRLSGNQPGLIGYWNFDDGTADDLSPNGNHGLLQGDAKIVDSDSPIAPIFVAPQPIIPPTLGKSFTSAVEISTFTHLREFTFDLSFDPSILNATGVEPGGLLGDVTCSLPQINNGRITGISCRRNGADGVTGSGVLATITFEAIGVGESLIKIENASFAAPDGTAIDFGTRDGSVTVFGPHGRVTGRVIDYTGVPVRSVPVLAFTEDTPVGIPGQTDGDGVYAIENITEAGDVTVRTRTPGLVPGVATVGVEIGQTTANIDFILEQATALNSVVDSEGFVRNWLLLGAIPWENDANRLISDQLRTTDADDLFPPPESETKVFDPQPRAGLYGTGLGATRRWTLHVDSDGDIDLGGLYGQSKSVVYAYTRVRSLREREVKLLLGSGDGVIVWLNDELVHLSGATRSRVADQDTVEKSRTTQENLVLKKGWNRLLVKVENTDGGWGFLVRFADADGTPITDIDVSPQLPIGGDIITPRGVFDLALDAGLNFVSLPVRPDTPFTAQTLVDKLKATMLVKFDTGRQTFVPYLPGLSTDFGLEGGIGYIVNVTEAKTVTFRGTVWDNQSAAPSPVRQPEPVWAFAIGGEILSDVGMGMSRSITIQNLRTGEIQILRFAQNDRDGLNHVRHSHYGF